MREPAGLRTGRPSRIRPRQSAARPTSPPLFVIFERGTSGILRGGQLGCRAPPRRVAGEFEQDGFRWKTKMVSRIDRAFWFVVETLIANLGAFGGGMTISAAASRPKPGRRSTRPAAVFPSFLGLLAELFLEPALAPALSPGAVAGARRPSDETSRHRDSLQRDRSLPFRAIR
jgi:hypothetical protein